MQQGQGTAGKLLKDPALYDDTRATIADVREDCWRGSTKGQGTTSANCSSRTTNFTHQLKGQHGPPGYGCLTKVNSGQGTLGQLVANPSLYESLDGTAKEMNGLMKDFRANPKKFLRIKLAIF